MTWQLARCFAYAPCSEVVKHKSIVEKMVEYAIAGMDNQLFVSTYMLQLPDKSTLEKFLLEEIEQNH